VSITTGTQFASVQSGKCVRYLPFANKEKFPPNNGVLSASVQTCMKERARCRVAYLVTKYCLERSRGSLRLTGPPVQWLLVSVPEIKRPERNDDH